jgi:hypothetical protein
MGVTRELIEFDRGDTSEVEARLASLPDGAWVNLEPILPDDDLDEIQDQTPGPLARVFGAKGPPIPFGTVVAQRDALAVGLEHGQGKRIVPELREVGIRVPDTWRRQQDHARRGVVYAVPRDEDPRVIVAWILDAAATAAVIPLRGRWSAMVATPS